MNTNGKQVFSELPTRVYTVSPFDDFDTETTHELPPFAILKRDEACIDDFEEVTRGTNLDLLQPLDYLHNAPLQNKQLQHLPFDTFAGIKSVPCSDIDLYLSDSAFSDWSDINKSCNYDYSAEAGDDFSYLCSEGSDSEFSTDITIPSLEFDDVMEVEYDNTPTINGLTNRTMFPSSRECVAAHHAPILPSMPHFLDRAYNFNVLGNLQDLIATIEKSLTACDVAFSFDPKCVMWSCQSETTEHSLSVRVYQRSSNDLMSHVVEIRRLSGCCVGYYPLYQNIRAAVLRSSSINTVY